MTKSLKFIFGILFVLYAITFLVAQIVINKKTLKDEKMSLSEDSITIEKMIKKKVEYQPGEFLPVPKPKPGDWLANYNESGQTLAEFITQKHNIPDSSRTKIYLFPLEDFSKLATVPSISVLKDFTSIYFNMPVEIMTSGKTIIKHVDKRNNPYSGQKQYHAGDILEEMKKVIPDDAFCVLAITVTDLYPEDSWNFVFGLGSFLERVGVFSFARYYPSEKMETGNKSEMIKENSLFNLRCCKIISHETGHMFGMEHCVAYLCNMNGSNNLREFDEQPLYLCPVCLSKLQRSVNFSIEKRYSNLLSFYQKNHFLGDVEWLNARINKIREN